MSRRSGNTEVVIQLSEDVVDRNGLALQTDATIEPTDNLTIAPWLLEPPSSPPRYSPTSSRSFGFSSKASISSILTMGSGSSLLQRHPRSSESQSTLGLSEKRRSADDEDSSRGIAAPSSSNLGEVKKKKSSLFAKLRSRSSKINLTSGEKDQFPPDQPPPPRPDLLYSPTGTAPSPTTSSVDKRDKRKKSSVNVTSSAAMKLEGEKGLSFPMDLNIEKMDGIIDLTKVPTGHGFSPSSSHSPSESLEDPHTFPPTTFTDPFAANKRTIPPIEEARRFSPKTTYIPAVSHHYFPQTAGTILKSNDGPHSPSWTAPESWAVRKEGDDLLDGEYSSSEDDISTTTSSVHKVAKSLSGSSHVGIQGRGAASGVSLTRGGEDAVQYKIRIYRDNATYHVVTIPASATVASLIGPLKGKITSPDKLQHKLYLKERGRERLLANTERPADIVRRRLEQAGFEPNDSIELLGGDGLSFLLRFMYKSQLLGPGDDELFHDLPFDAIDLSGKGLRTIPVVLHQNAESIVTLKLSRNPMLEIPLDFIQACTTLRDLRLSNMGIKKVPQSLRHSTTLQRLDLSSNRISDISDAYLDHIQCLVRLYLQNNRLDKLPWSLPRMRNLVTLDISSNKFMTFPEVVTQLDCLRELDISFNAISELPDKIGQLSKLERLSMVGNQVTKFPDEMSGLISLQYLNCNRNQILDLTTICSLPRIEAVNAAYNNLHALEASTSPSLVNLHVPFNDITQFSVSPGPLGKIPESLTSLDLSYAKLSSLDDLSISRLSSLRVLKLDNNSFRYLPDSIGDLHMLETLSCSNNNLDTLPSTIGRLQKLEVLDAHNNDLRELPQSLWNCASLLIINVSSNFIGSWHDPPINPSNQLALDALLQIPAEFDRKSSTASLQSRALPPLVHSLEKLYMAENKLTDDVLHPLMIFKELRVINLSFNDIQDLPQSFFRNMGELEQIYMSGNKLTSIPTEDLPRLKRLSVLFLNGNRLQTLPQELKNLKHLIALDVGSNILRYNIHNTEFDWNWNSNKALKYLNLSGNKRFQIHRDAHRTLSKPSGLERQAITGFTNNLNLRVLGLMDVTMSDAVDVPDENPDRRVRTSPSTISGLGYGMADSLGRHDYLTMLDLVHEFRDKEEAIFAMFGQVHLPKSHQQGTSPNLLSKFLHDSFIKSFSAQMAKKEPTDGIPDVLRRTFLTLNHTLHDHIYANSRKMSSASATSNSLSRDQVVRNGGAAGIVMYVREKTVFVANVGNALAIISNQGKAHLISRKHDPFDPLETARIRATEGWVSSSGLVNDQVETCRAFGHYSLMPIVNARPDIVTWELSDLDEFVIIANAGLWDYIPHQTAVDIARTVLRSEKRDPMIAAQKLRDFAMSYGADGSIMIMVIWVADIIDSNRTKQSVVDGILDPQIYRARKKDDDILDRNIARLDGEVSAPKGHVTLVFTDIRNSTHLYEANPGMATAMRLHNSLLRRQLRFCGGYEVKTEGDAFMCSFTNTLAAVWWCLSVQQLLLHEPWPLEILECEDGKPVYDADGLLIARGLSVRMGIHCGEPTCETDPITSRMDYFGSIVNRTARISGSAAGGQIMVSADVLREIDAKVREVGAETEYSRLQSTQAIDAIKRIGIEVVTVGERRLKGLELPEMLSLIYPTELKGRHNNDTVVTQSSSSDLGSRVQFSIPQMKELGVICLRLEYLASGRLFRPLVVEERKRSIQSMMGSSSSPTTSDATDLKNSIEDTSEVCGDAIHLLPPMTEDSSDNDMMFVLDSLSVRIQNALAALALKVSTPTPSALPDPGMVEKDVLVSALARDGMLDERTMRLIEDVLRNL